MSKQSVGDFYQQLTINQPRIQTPGHNHIVDPYPPQALLRERVLPATLVLKALAPVSKPILRLCIHSSSSLGKNPSKLKTPDPCGRSPSLLIHSASASDVQSSPVQSRPVPYCTPGQRTLSLAARDDKPNNAFTTHQGACLSSL